MYGLPQTGSPANKLLQKRLSTYGFIPTPLTPGLWRHETRSIHFHLVLYDFGVEYEWKEDARYLLEALNGHYEAVAEYWEGNISYVIKIEWYSIQQKLYLSIPGYVGKLIHKCQHITPSIPEHHPQ